MNIRPYQKKDFRFVQDICMATSSLKDDDTPTNRAYLCALYCDYYVDNRPETCFVAVDDDDTPIGYVLCAADRENYAEMMDEYYLPLVRKLNSGSFFHFNAMSKVEQRYVRQGYTAHLHIDILEDYQRQGIGTQLIQALSDKLTELEVEGVYLICDAKNTAAKSFYEKLGFEDIDYITGAVVYGKKFITEDGE